MFRTEGDNGACSTDTSPSNVVNFGRATFIPKHGTAQYTTEEALLQKVKQSLGE